MKKAITIRVDENLYNEVANDADSRGVSMNRAFNDRVSRMGSTINVQGNLYKDCTINNYYPGTNSKNENNIIEDVPFRED